MPQDWEIKWKFLFDHVYGIDSKSLCTIRAWDNMRIYCHGSKHVSETTAHLYILVVDVVEPKRITGHLVEIILKSKYKFS